MNEFKNYHPCINLIFFVSVFAYSMCFMHPISLMVSLFSSFTYSIFLHGKKAIRLNFLCLLPLLLISALFNPLFNHQGITILSYFPSGNPLTLESVIYGFAAAVMLVSVISWFSCLNEIMTDDKIIYLFGKVLPSLSLVISMTLRFVPKFKAHLSEVSRAQSFIGRDTSTGSIIKKAKCGITILSIMITWALENAVETADSMKSRGYGLPGRTSFSIFNFDKRDKKALIYLILINTYILVGVIGGYTSFTYFPKIAFTSGIYSFTVFFAYLMLCTMPVIIELTEDKKWKS